jgi:predicted dehydrogenase
MADREIRWGVLSTANIGRWAVNPAIEASGNGRLVAVGSRTQERADGFAREHSIFRAHGSYEALVADPDVDALYIPLPNSLHHEWSIRAMEAGKHVLCEKPLALDRAECEAMAEAAEANSVKLMEAFMYRFHPRTERVLEMLKAGLVGEIRAIRSAFTFRLKSPENIRLSAELGGGALMDVGCYCVNVSRTLMGREPEAVQAHATWADTGVDAQLAGTLRFADGVTAQFDCALTMERREFYEVAGTDGGLVVDAAFLPGTDDVVIRNERGREEPSLHTIHGADEYRRMVEHFADCVLNDLPVRYDAREAGRNMAVIEALYRSARNGGAVEAVPGG